MLAKVLRVLEYEKMKEQLYEHVSSSLGRVKIKELTPSTDKDEISIWLEQTYEATKVLRLKGQIPLGGIFDIRASVKRAEIGASLNAAELLEIASTSYGARRLKKFIEEMIEDEVELPLLGGIVRVIIPLTDMEREIKQCISDNGEVLDSASAQLRGFRQQIRSLESGIRSKLESITRSQSSQKMLSDAIVTIRNDRFVVPVKQEYRGSFGGIVHDQSASGATLFIEPQAVVTMNNQLRAAKMSEAKEIERILHELTGKVAEFVAELLVNVDALGELDFIFTKARYSQKIKAVQPKLNDRFSISLFKARHPLIPTDEVVPIDVDLGQSYSSLIITGPNTGGKPSH